MQPYVLSFRDIDRTLLQTVGGKGANLGELSRIDGVPVPEGFCITTAAYRDATGGQPELSRLLEELSHLRVEDRERLRETSARLRTLIEGVRVPEALAAELAARLEPAGEGVAYAVRSSATAEDLPTASFAGQQDTYLNVVGARAVLARVSRCWASLFTERAVTYRIQQGVDHRKVQLAVVIQRMVFPEAAGVLFTADPLSSHRKHSSIDAVFGLGEALVSGQVNADTYRVLDAKRLDKKVASKHLELRASREGGTETRPLEAERRSGQVLTDEQIWRLEALGRRIEAHFGQPQDIEWCLAGETFFIVQSRPITTLYPIPEATDREPHVYVSVGHQQMMTDPMKPLGLSLFQQAAARPMYSAGGRLFVDITQQLASPASRQTVIEVLGRSDPLIKDALLTLVGRGDFVKPAPVGEPAPPAREGGDKPFPINLQTRIEYDPALVPALIAKSEASVKELKRSIQAKTGLELLDFILEDSQQAMKRVADSRSLDVIMTAVNTSAWLNEKLQEWLGEKNVADALTQSAPGNITSEMGLDLLDVADEVRAWPEVIQFLRQVKDDGFLDGLPALTGGREVRKALETFLEKYGMRCPGEIDLTTPRWSERPAALVPLILNNLKNFEPGASKRKFEQGRQEARRKEHVLLERLRQLPDGEQKAQETQQNILLLRGFIGYREYPKYHLVNRYFVYKQALLREAEKLAEAGVIPEREDIYYLTFDELREALRTQAVDGQLLGKRKDEFALAKRLVPPRVLTSEGEIVAGRYHPEKLPAGALAGLAVSSGVVEGRARVISRMEEAVLDEGDILVTSFTDPSWTPLFVSLKGLVTEVGGLMTHGAVIAREYGLPAVVGVENATRLIQDGQRIRVNGTEGYVEWL